MKPVLGFSSAPLAQEAHGAAGPGHAEREMQIQGKSPARPELSVSCLAVLPTMPGNAKKEGVGE